MEFFSLHGYYPEEQLLGNRYVVDVIVELDRDPQPGDRLEDTLNYEKIFEIVKRNMNKSVKLLETVLHHVHADILSEYPEVYSIDVCICKRRPLIDSLIGESVVQFKKRYHV